MDWVLRQSIWKGVNKVQRLSFLGMTTVEEAAKENRLSHIRCFSAPDLHLFAHLAHEVGDDPVEGGALEAEALLAGAESAEVLRGLGHHVSAQLKHKI